MVRSPLGAKALWLIGLLCACSLPVLAAGDPALLPPDGFAAGWVRDGAPKTYEGEALYDHIDGGGEVFLEFGFEACTVQRYRKGAQEFTLELYRMSDAVAALGIYLTQCGLETPDKSLSERHTVGRNQLLLVKGRYYLVATGPEPWPDLPVALVAAAHTVAAGVAPGEPPDCLGWLPEEDLDPHSVRILRGPIGLQAVVTLGEGDVLLLDRRVTAVAGEYREKDGATGSLIAVEYPTEAEAAAPLRHLRTNLDPQIGVVASSDGRLVFKDWKGRYGLATLHGRRLTVRSGLLAAPAG